MTESHIDSEALEELKDVMEDEFQSLIETFIVDADKKMIMLRAAIDANNADEVGKVSHSFKGSCSNIGAPVLSGLCKRSEDMGRNQDISSVEPVYSEIAEEYQLVRSLLAQYL